MNELQVLQNQVTELKELVYQNKADRLADSLYSPELAPHYMKLASHLCQASLVPKAYQGKPNDLFIAMATGYQIGLSIEQSIQGIAVINGKPCLWGDDLLALVLAHKDCVDVIEHALIDENGNIYGYECIAKRKKREDKSREFTLEMAKKAGLLSKQGVWQQYPARMLQMRARSFALRDQFADVLKGVKSREEIEDYIEAEFKVVDNKTSRTDFLKKDLSGNNDKKSNQESVVENSNVETEKGSKQDDSGMESNGIPEAEPEARETNQQSNPFETITADQLKAINKLIKEKSITKEVFYKHLAYYEVEDAKKLTQEMAAHLISELQNLQG